ncbi:hypothetical protein AVEN_127884-1 [Araneus ventricosus]|uniref:Uncharacterized protein n=1 Tax=Araneus ventricosus TaxID=182803 RepID=A0A4Y1ZZK4_ARAVE|nr:hypothetical protein AVEN_127884-1 [Araneus ventricosus]
MEEVIDGVLVSTANCVTRKRHRTGGKRTEAEKKRYSEPSGNNVYVPCKHSSKTLSCTDVRPNDVKKLRDKLYKVADKQRQYSIIALLVITKNVTRRRPNNQTKTNRNHQAHSMHFLLLILLLVAAVGEFLCAKTIS